MTAIGQYRHVVQLDNPGPPVADGDGGYRETFAPLDPPFWDCAILPATARSLEAIASGTVLAQATLIMRGWYHPGITTDTRITFDGRTLNVVYVGNREERDIETELVAAEVVA